MPAHVTSRFGLVGFDPTGSDLITSLPTMVNRFLDEIDAEFTGWSSGVIASRPAAGTAGRVYLATDDRTSSPNGTLYFDNGTAWVIAPTNNYAAGVIASRPRTGTRGQLFYATDDTTAGTNGTLYVFDGTSWNQIQTGGATSLASSVTQVFAAGDLKMTAKSRADAGWLMCDGTAYSRTTYAALFTAISTTYGAGDGSTTFNVPDLRGRVAVGPDGSAGRLSANDALGQASGSETHSHGSGSYTAGSHSHAISGEPNANAGAFQGGGINVDRPVNNHSHGGATGASTASVTGTSTTVSNMPPYQIVNYVIKT